MMKSKKSAGYSPKLGDGVPSSFGGPDMNVWKIVKKTLPFFGTRPFFRIASGLIEEIQAALLHPAREIAGADFVGNIERRMIGHKKCHRRIFIRDALPRKRELERREGFCFEIGGPGVLRDDIAAALSRSISDVSGELMMLELQGAVRNNGGGYYARG